MIHWQLQDGASLRAGVGAPGAGSFLSPAEQKKAASLRMPKRREDWLLGRWTAKRLVRDWLAEEHDLAVPLAVVEIENEPSGAPVVRWGAPGLDPGWLSVSISHSHGWALSALCADEGVVVGVDLERVEPRSGGFVEDYFAEQEVAALGATAGDRDLLVTALWSAKESVLKALGLGLTVDTRRLDCRWSRAPQADRWERFDAIFCDPDPSHGEQAIGGWWRSFDPFVMTVASLRRPPEQTRHAA